LLRESFSSKYNVRFGTAEEFTEQVSSDFRCALLNLISGFVDRGCIASWNVVYRALCESARCIEWAWDRHADIHVVYDKLRTVEWHCVLDFIEALKSVIRAETDENLDIIRSSDSVLAEFIADVNMLFREERVRYQLDLTGVHPALPSEVTALENRVLSKLAFLKGGTVVEKHLQKARKFLAMRPEPDEENCIKELVSAMESTVKMLSGNDSMKLKKFLDSQVCRDAIHRSVRRLIQEFYGFASNEQGIRHGAGSEGEKVSLEDVIFSYYQALSAVELLLTKLSPPPTEPQEDESVLEMDAPSMGPESEGQGVVP